MARKRRIVDANTENAMKRARTAVNMIQGRLISKKLSATDRVIYETNLAAVKALQKSLKTEYDEAKKTKFKSSMSEFLNDLGKVKPGTDIVTDLT